MYPGYTLHTVKNVYSADTKSATSDDKDDCNKVYNVSTNITRLTTMRSKPDYVEADLL